MKQLAKRIAVTGLLVAIFVAGWASDHYLTAPHQVTGQAAKDIVTWCTPIGAASIPPPWNNWIPAEYRNGSYQLYSCKVN